MATVGTQHHYRTGGVCHAFLVTHVEYDSNYVAFNMHGIQFDVVVVDDVPTVQQVALMNVPQDTYTNDETTNYNASAHLDADTWHDAGSCFIVT